jgi:hypothetical protein
MESDDGRMPPDDRRPPRICGRNGFSRHRTESLRDALGANVVRRDQRDEPVDLWTPICPVANGCGCLGRISLSPVRPRQGPAKLGLSITSGACPSRRRPVACVKDHEPSLADHLPVGCRGLENERAKPIGSPTADHSFDHGSDFLDRRDGLFAQALHDLRVREQLVQMLRILGAWHAQAEPLRIKAEFPGRGLLSHARDASRSLHAQPNQLARGSRWRTATLCAGRDDDALGRATLFAARKQKGRLGRPFCCGPNEGPTGETGFPPFPTSSRPYPASRRRRRPGSSPAARRRSPRW